MKKNLVKSLAFTFMAISIGYTACEKEVDYTAQLIQQEIDDREAYLEAENIGEEKKTTSGLYYIETIEGAGVQANAGDIVHVHYEGRYLNGGIFDSSWARGKPIDFTLGVGAVIAGWDEGIALMKEGGRARLVIPSELAYGTGNGNIPPYTTLVFDVELVDVK